MKAYLEMEEAEQLEKAAACVRDRLLIRILTRLGCRISEALALTVDDIDLDQSTVTIQHLKTCWNMQHDSSVTFRRSTLFVEIW